MSWSRSIGIDSRRSLLISTEARKEEEESIFCSKQEQDPELPTTYALAIRHQRHQMDRYEIRYQAVKWTDFLWGHNDSVPFGEILGLKRTANQFLIILKNYFDLMFRLSDFAKQKILQPPETDLRQWDEITELENLQHNLV